MAETYVPVMRHVATLHKALDEHVDVPYGKGLKLFNSACKELEAASLAEYQELVEAYGTIRVMLHFKSSNLSISLIYSACPCSLTG